MKPQLTVGIVAKHDHPKAAELTKKIIDWLSTRKIAYSLDSKIAEVISHTENVYPRNEVSTNSDIIVVLGGDGTLISACRTPSKRLPKIIGINLGTLGFLTEITTDEVIETLEATVEDKVKLEKHRLFQVKVTEENKSSKIFYALNDVVLTKEALARIFGVEITVNNEFAAVIRGDGVIIATPIGSTAYSLAAGGSIVHPQVDSVLITPICPHTLSSRPLVLPGNSIIDMKLALDNKPKISAVHLTMDGQEGMEITAGQVINISTSNYYVNFVKSSKRNYFQVLGTKLKWASKV
ncbi:MAG: NAD(+)/NADH kinase [Proteobacteria bacterium]|nr:NAD(+)/NADH kinase [Pseudomonadota bacterium]